MSSCSIGSLVKSDEHHHVFRHKERNFTTVSNLIFYLFSSLKNVKVKNDNLLLKIHVAHDGV